jgi:hypothetical protein
MSAGVVSGVLERVGPLLRNRVVLRTAPGVVPESDSDFIRLSPRKAIHVPRQCRQRCCSLDFS